ncbi:MAG: four helix bundle protein [Candidatus Hatepunaea meridiana]|nr:four helix bundle protein [Candidatus Hatepunaea meridiana]
MKENIIKEKSFGFALEIIKLYQLLRSQKEFVISRQLLKSGTSIGANISEAEAAQSKKDFLSKMSIASKEARETKYWLDLLDKSDLVNIPLQDYLSEINQIINILTKIVKTTSEYIKAK